MHTVCIQFVYGIQTVCIQKYELKTLESTVVINSFSSIIIIFYTLFKNIVIWQQL
jgi:hypothetical protein